VSLPAAACVAPPAALRGAPGDGQADDAAPDDQHVGGRVGLRLAWRGGLGSHAWLAGLAGLAVHKALPSPA
jgi:hypothetical protein